MQPHLRHELGERILGRLLVRGVLGSGTYGTVYHCVDPDGVELAVKEMHVFADALTAEQALKYFRREAEHLARLDHPAIPHAEAVDLEGPFRIDPATGLEAPDAPDAVTVESRYYLLMEYVAGESLEAIIRRAADPTALPSVGLVLDWVRSIGNALSYLHGLKLVHRDVKPANLLIRDVDHTAALIDFGLCREALDEPGYGTLPMSDSGRFGTPGYAPPDPVEQENPIPASDQHALAMTARRALTGLDPTRLEELEVLRGKRMTELRPELEPHVAAAIDRAIRPLAEDRFASVARFLAALEAPPAPLASPPRTPWVELVPREVEVGRVPPGQLVDLVLSIRDRRTGMRPRGYAVSNDDRLRILPPTAHGNEIALHLLLKVPRNALPGPVRTQLVVTANDEEHIVPILYQVDPELRATRPGCLLGLLSG